MAILVGFLNMEFIVIPLILKGLFDFKGWDLKITAAIWATAEICFWYLFSGWLVLEIQKTEEVREAIGIGKRAVPEIKDSYFFWRAEKWTIENIINKFNPENYKGRAAYVLLKGSGYLFGLPLFFGFGLIPVLWIPGLAIARIIAWKFGWRLGFWFLVLGNMLKNIGFAEGWDIIWKFVGKT